MRMLIYSDVHGNLPAFEKMLAHAGVCECYICLGDLVNYGPWSNECVDLALSLPNSILLMGNHEEAFLAGAYPGNNELVKKFFATTIAGFQRIPQISGFLQEYKLDNFICRHTILNEYIYPDAAVKLDADYFIGHSHHQFKYTFENHILYNAGSVGQNRKLINVCSYLIYDTELKRITMENVVYPFEQIISKMRSLKYSDECIDYYLKKELR